MFSRPCPCPPCPCLSPRFEALSDPTAHVATHQEGQGVGVQREVEWPLSVCNVSGKSKRRCQEGRIESRVEIQRDYSLQSLQHFSTQFWRSEANDSVKELTTKDYQRKQPESHIVWWLCLCWLKTSLNRWNQIRFKCFKHLSHFTFSQSRKARLAWKR